jgi:hypothetical protein
MVPIPQNNSNISFQFFRRASTPHFASSGYGSSSTYNMLDSGHNFLAEDSAMHGMPCCAIWN